MSVGSSAVYSLRAETTRSNRTGESTAPVVVTLTLPAPPWMRNADAAPPEKTKAKGMYECPLYLYPLRTGSRERPSWMLNIDIKSGQPEPEQWVKRGTALLLALAE